MSLHLRRRRDLEGTGSRAGSRSGAGDFSQSMPSVGIPISRYASLEHSNSGARTSNTGARVRKQGGGVDPAKDKSAPQSTHGAAAAGLDTTDSPKISAYHGPVSSITKHFFMVGGQEVTCQGCAHVLTTSCILPYPCTAAEQCRVPAGMNAQLPNIIIL